MKRNVLYVAVFAALSLLLMACPNPTDDNGSGPSPIAVANTEWSDSLNPETTLVFIGNEVTLGGQPSAATNNKNWYWDTLDGRSLPYELVEEAAAKQDIADRVEDNWGTNYTMPDAIVVVWTDPANKIGLQLYYYRAGTGKNYERLVCWGIGQPHEFRKK